MQSVVHKAVLLHHTIFDLDALFLMETWFTISTRSAVTEDNMPPKYVVLNIPVEAGVMRCSV